MCSGRSPAPPVSVVATDRSTTPIPCTHIRELTGRPPAGTVPASVSSREADEKIPVRRLLARLCRGPARRCCRADRGEDLPRRISVDRKLWRAGGSGRYGGV